MKLRSEPHNGLVIEEIFSGVILRTSEGNEIGLCMRDDTIELNIMPFGVDTQNWWRVDMKSGECGKMGNGPDPTT